MQIGRKGLHIFDVDREQWVFNSRKPGYNYQDLHYMVKGITNSDEEYGIQDYDDEVEEEEVVGQIVEEQKEEQPQQIEETKESTTFDFKAIFNEIMRQIRERALNMPIVRKQVLGIVINE